MIEGQQSLFSFVMQYALRCKLTVMNKDLPPKPFQISLSGGASVGKTKYLKQVLRYPNQSLDQPSVLVTTSTGKAATGISNITLHPT